MSYLKLVIAFVAGVVIAVLATAFVPDNVKQMVFGASSDLSTISNPWNFTNNVGFGSTSPAYDLSFSNTGTTTIFADKLCLVVKTDGSGSDYLYYFLSTTSGNAAVGGWATSTSPCY